MKKQLGNSNDTESIEPMAGALKFEAWLNKRTLKQQQAFEQYKKDHPDRYFVAFVKVYFPICSAPESVWPRHINDTLAFEQEKMPSIDDVINTAKKAWHIADKVEVINFYELSKDDYVDLVGDESEWRVVEE